MGHNVRRLDGKNGQVAHTHGSSVPSKHGLVMDELNHCRCIYQILDGIAIYIVVNNGKRVRCAYEYKLVIMISIPTTV